MYKGGGVSLRFPAISSNSRLVNDSITSQNKVFTFSIQKEKFYFPDTQFLPLSSSCLASLSSRAPRTAPPFLVALAGLIVGRGAPMDARTFRGFLPGGPAHSALHGIVAHATGGPTYAELRVPFLPGEEPSLVLGDGEGG